MSNVISGIYMIKNIKNDKVYIGSSKDIEHRWWSHTSKLTKNNHYNNYLQYSWNKYGEESFEFSILEVVDDLDNLIPTEQKWIDTYESYLNQNGYNICPTAGNSLGTTHSEETKRLIGSKSKERNAVKNIYGMKRVGEQHGNALIKNEDARIIKLLAKDGRLTSREIGELFGIHKETAFQIIKNRSWKHVEISEYDQLPDKYLNIIQDIVKKRELKNKISSEDVKCIKLLLRDSNLNKTQIACLFNISFSYLSGINSNQKRTNIILNDGDCLEQYRQFLLSKGVNLDEIIGG